MTSFKFFVLSFSLFILSGCSGMFDREEQADFSFSRDLTMEELNFVPYHVGDQVSFKNTSGEILDFVCEKRDHYRDRYDPKAICNGNVQNCTVWVDYHLDVRLKCVSNNNNIINIHYNTRWSRYDIDFLTAQARPYRLDTASCEIKTTPEILCLNSSIINNKTYYNVMKSSERNWKTYKHDIIYYNKDKGVLKVYIVADNETWELQ